MTKAEQLESIDKLLTFNETDKSCEFFKVFYLMCRRALFSRIIKLRDHNRPIVDMVLFDAYITDVQDPWGTEEAIVAWYLPRLWRQLCGLRNVKGDGTKQDH